MSIHTADLCDENKDKKIAVLSAKFKNYGGLKEFSGEIVTVKLDKSNWRLLEMLRDEDGKGKIVVVDNAQQFYGVVGDKLMTFAKKNNWKAIILNGYVRDIDETKNIDVGLLAIGTCPLRNFEVTDSQRDIELNFEGVTFNNGDFVYADNDGVIITKNRLI
ncbi:MAG: ribonuclease E activity regulator RraA [Aliarcobacter sp.]|jgi:regulator of ribonuclease activity A|nr:ribonuclease E activity regulator RraA [Aliarcobacter sp.]